MVQLLCGSTVGYPSDSWAAGLIHGPLDSVLMNLDVYGLLYFVGLYTMTCQTRQTIQHYRGRRSASIYGRFAPPPAWALRSRIFACDWTNDADVYVHEIVQGALPSAS